MIIENMSNDEYHSKTDHVSNSMLSKVNKSPAHFQNWLRYGQGIKSDAMILGSALHTLVLEQDKFDKEFAVLPDFGDKRKKENKERAKQWYFDNAEKEIIKGEQYENCRSMQCSILAHPLAGRLLDKPGKSEVSFFTIDPETGVKVKWRIDRLTECGWIIDVKTTKDANPIQFAKSVFNFRYHCQAAMYMDFTKLEDIFVKGFVFIAVESLPPFNVCVFVLDNEAEELGRSTYRQDLDLYAECLESNKWPGIGYDYEKEKYSPVKLSLPSWCFNQ